MTTTCLLNHAPIWSSEVSSCETPATYAWYRHGKTPIPCCSKGLKAGRDVRRIVR